MNKYTFDFSKMTKKDTETGKDISTIADFLQLIDRFCVGGIRHLSMDEVFSVVAPQFAESLRNFGLTLAGDVMRDAQSPVTETEDVSNDDDLRDMLDGIEGLG